MASGPQPPGARWWEALLFWIRRRAYELPRLGRWLIATVVVAIVSVLVTQLLADDVDEPTVIPPSSIHVESTRVLPDDVDAEGITRSYGADQTLDEDPTTAWVEGSPGFGANAAITYRFGRTVTLHHLRIRNGYGRDPRRFNTNNRIRVALLIDGQGDVQRIPLPSTPRPTDVEMEAAVAKTDLITIKVVSVYRSPRGTGNDTALTEVEFFSR